jgi:orotate phosphoribosyltransferase-like protein
MSKISNIKKYAAQWLKHTGLSNEDIAKEIKISSSDINEIFAESENNTALPNKNLMITHTAGKKINSVAIMTKEASESVDTIRNSVVPSRDQKGIFRPKKK